MEDEENRTPVLVQNDRSIKYIRMYIRTNTPVAYQAHRSLAAAAARAIDSILVRVN